MYASSLLALLLSVAALTAPVRASSTLQDRIKNVVVLVQENRSFDTFFGGLNYTSDIDNLVGKTFCNPVDVTDPSKGNSCASASQPNKAKNDPDHSITGINMQLYGTYHPDPNSPIVMSGFATEQARVYNAAGANEAAAEVMDYISPEHIPVFNTMAQNYVVFDRWFAALPGPTNPNRAYITSGQSHGEGDNTKHFYGLLPQKSIFQQLDEAGISWHNYADDLLGIKGDANFYTWTVLSGSSISRVKTVRKFYEEAAAGKLPQFSYITPECCDVSSFHPSSLISNGEAFVKKVYESLRASPQWNNTLFIITFDEHGGFADHVPPPTGWPAGTTKKYTEKAPDGKKYTFDFTRLGARVPAMLISPWVEKGVVEHKGSNYGGEYTHTSILNFVSNLWGLKPLTDRVAHSSTFEHLITDRLRDDTPATLPVPTPF